MPDTTLYVRDTDRNRVGEVSDYRELELRLRFNRAGSWVLEVPASSSAAALLSADGAGLVVVRDDVTLLSGPRRGRRRTWNAREDLIFFSGPDDLTWLEDNRAWPEAPALTTATDAYDVRTGAAETVIREYVDNNIGPSAASSRKVAGLTLAADSAAGITVTGRARFHQLAELCRELALVGGDLGFRVAQSGTDLELQVYEPTDRTTEAIFSKELGNLRAFDYFEDAASTNYAIVAGGGEGTLRTFALGGDAASIGKWGRIETFVDQRQTSDTTELTQKRDEILAEQATRTGLTISPVDTEKLAFGADYDLGDKVTVVVDDVPIQDVIREIHLTYDGNGETVRPTVGTPGEQDRTLMPRIFETLAATRRAISHLERR